VSITGWIGTGVGLIVIGACFILALFVNHLPKFSHPWVHRFLIVAMYAGATALLVTTIGQFALNTARTVAGFLGGFGTGLGKAAIVLAALFLLLSVLIALIKVPSAGAAPLAVLLAFALALVPGGFLHQFYVATAAPGQQFAGQFAGWLGG
jgi:ABC-type antimicrobial peptide transport system permease subunit